MKNVLPLLTLSLFLIFLSLAEKAEVGVVIYAKETTSSTQFKSTTSSPSVIITDSITNWQSTLTDSKKLNSFYYYWSQKKPFHAQKNQVYQWRYQLLVQDNNKTSRWVYDPRGYAREVTLNQSSTVYQLATIRAFNSLLKSLSTQTQPAQ
ncbi:MAG: hypothetical protein ACI9IA_001737 [Enterobacterales bacterium]|jgi:hypothetical protein